MDAGTSPAEYGCQTPQEALRDRLLCLFRQETVEAGWAVGWACDEGDLEVVVHRFDTSGIDKSLDVICADKALRALALNPATRITTPGMGTEYPLFLFENGADADVYADNWEGDVDFPEGLAMVISGDCLATARPALRGAPGFGSGFVRTAEHRRREAALFKQVAQKERGADLPNRAFADALVDMAEACEQDAKQEDRIAHDLRRSRFEGQMKRVAHQRGRVATSGLHGRRRDRRLRGQRQRPRAMARSYSRGGDSGSDSESEPAGDGDPAGVVSQAFAALRRWWQ